MKDESKQPPFEFEYDGNVNVIVEYFTKNGEIGNPEELKFALKNFLFQSFDECYKAVYSGLTGNELRDKFAIGALQGLMANLHAVVLSEKKMMNDLVRLAYLYADAMIAKRQY